MMNRVLETCASDCHPASVPDYTPLPELRALQLQRLQAVVTRAWQHVEPFHLRMDELGLAPESIRSLEDIARLPFTQKSDLRDNYPFGLFASPMKDVVRLHASSGTTGKPIVVAYTQADVDVWTSVLGRALAGCGLHRGDIIQVAYGYGLFTGGLGAHYGAEGLGATVVPASGGHADRQIMLMKDFGVTAMCCTPTYFLHLIDCAAELGVDLKTLPLRAGVFGAEPWTDAMRAHIEKMSGIEAFDIYGLSEIIGPGVGCECRCHQGLHIFEDHFYPEVVDPETGATLADGELGELVLTTLSKQAMPMIRYRTHDITRILPGTCECGRTLAAHRPHRPAQRRHADYPRRQCIPVAGGNRSAHRRRRVAPFPDYPYPLSGIGSNGSAGRGHARHVQR
jgi:phenylacetate-CoA ligase